MHKAKLFSSTHFLIGMVKKKTFLYQILAKKQCVKACSTINNLFLLLFTVKF